MNRLLIIFVLFSFCLLVIPVQSLLAQSDTTARKNQRRPSSFFPVPGLSYTPETQLTLGGAAIYYLDAAKGDTTARMSNIQGLAVYTTANQFLIDSKWFIVTRGEGFIFSGRTFFHIYPDRHYGFGNNSDGLVRTVDVETGEMEMENYLLFNTKRVHFAPVLLRKIRKNLYAGLQYEYEHLFDFSIIPDSVTFISDDILEVPVTGPRSGLGLNLTYDSRDNAINPLKGQYIQFQNWFFSEKLGSNYNYQVYRVDGRTYHKTFKDQTAAFQLVVDQRFTNDASGIPFRGLARFGGADLVRGYFYGTYQANNLVMFQAEYRWPIYTFKRKFPLFDAIGMVGFVGGGQVFNEWSEFSPSDLRVALGAGIRLSLDKAERLNVGIDYGIGLHGTSDLDQRQTGFYFFLGETF